MLLAVQQPNYLFKIVAIGSGGVGKTSLIRRFAESRFDASYLPTLGVDITTKRVEVDGIEVKLICVDTAGQEYFSKLRPTYYKGANGALVVFDITKLKTFEAVDRWLSELKNNVEEEIPKILIGNKTDLPKRNVSMELIEEISKRENMKYYEASALDGRNVDNIFFELTRAILSYDQKLKVTS